MIDFRTASQKTEKEFFAFLSSGSSGLNNEEVQKRMREYGANTFAEKKTKWWRIVVRQFHSAFAYLLGSAALIAFLIGEYLDGILILLFLFLNAFLGFIQEYRTEHALRALKKFVRHMVRAKRNGVYLMIPVEEIVPGDIVSLRAGDMIPADGYFFHANNVWVDESVLTGESVPVEKTSGRLAYRPQNEYGAANIGFSKTTFTSGEGELLIFATGEGTAVGSMHTAVEIARGPSALEMGMSRLSTVILKVMLLMVPALFVAHFAVKGSALPAGKFLIFLIALTVSVIPEALPLIITLSLSRGALRLARLQVVPRRLSAIEDLGSVEILCTDKTGTLTENKLKVAEVFGDRKKVLDYSLMASVQFIEALPGVENVFDHALLQSVSEGFEKWAHSLEVRACFPFDPIRRRESVFIRNGKEQFLLVRSAPEFILARIADGKIKQEVQDWIYAQGARGRRILAVAKKSFAQSDRVTPSLADEKDSDFVGLVSFADPLKATAKQAIHDAQNLGVRIKILSGDSKEVTGQVACDAGIIARPEMVMIGDAFDRLSSVEKQEATVHFDVFARMLPVQKQEIIQLLKKDHIVGFLGDGFNDAPALKLADVAIAVEGASDIARDESDIVLLNKSLHVIIDGIREGRKIFANTLKYIRVTLASNFGNFAALVFISFFVPYLPILPAQILLLNLCTDFPMMSIATDSVDSKELKRPRAYHVREIAFFTIMLGLLSTIFDFIFFALFSHFGPGAMQSLWFTWSVLTELVFIFSVRSGAWFFKAKAPGALLISLSGSAAVLAIGLPFFSFGQKWLSFEKPSVPALLGIGALVAVSFFATDACKHLLHRFLEHHHRPVLTHRV